MTPEQWHAARERDKQFRATELGGLFSRYNHALIAYWQRDGDDTVSSKRLRELDEAAREAEKAFKTKLMEVQAALSSIDLIARDYLHVSTPQEDVNAALVAQFGRIRETAARALGAVQ